MMLTDQACFRLGHGFRLQWEPAQNSRVLLYPEGMIKLNQSAGEILTRCDGSTPLTILVEEIEKTFQAQGLRPEIEAFLNLAMEKRWIQAP